MSNLIERDDALKEIWEWIENREYQYTNATHWLQKRIEAIPTIEAVSVVRCKECKNWKWIEWAKEYRCILRNTAFNAKADDFCSYGEREGE